MAITLNDFDDSDSGPREKIGRALGVAGAIYGLLALITGAVAVAGTFGLAGLAIDPGAVEPARLLGVPWTLFVPAAKDLAPIPSLALSLGGLVVNFAVLMIAAAFARGPRRGL